MKRSHVIWIPIGLAMALSVLALVTMLGGLNGSIRALVERRLADTLEADVSIASLDGNPLFEFSLSRVEVLASDGTTFRCGEVVVSYRPVSLLWGNVVVDSIRLASPRVELRRSTSEAAPGEPFDHDALPSVDLKNIVVERGVVTLEDDGVSYVANDLQFELGFNNTGGEAALEVRRLKTLVLDPPIQITNLEGLALSRENMLLFQGVKVSSPRSSVILSGEIVGLANPLYRFDVTVDSLSLAEVTQATGVDLPDATLWLSGRIEGSRQRSDVTFDWVVGGAAGDVKLRLSDDGEPSHRIEIHGREVDLTALSGVPVRGDVILTAEGKGLDLTTAEGNAQASVLNGSLYGVGVDSVAAEFRYGKNSVEGGLLLDGDIGTFYGAMRIDAEQRLFVNGRLAGVDLAHAGGPTTRIGGDLRISRLDRTTRIGLELDQVVAFDRRLGTVEARLSQSDSVLALENFAWAGFDDAFKVSGRGDVWRQVDGMFELDFNGAVAPDLFLDRESLSGVEPVTFVSRIWSESLTFGATRERIALGANLAGVLGLDSLDVEATADGGRVTIDRFEARGDSAMLTATGEAILESAFDLAATYTADRMHGGMGGVFEGLEAFDVQVDASVVGPWEDPEILAELVSQRLLFAGGTFEELSAEAHVPVLGDGGVSLQARQASWGGRRLPGFYADVGSSGSEVSFLVGNSDGSENQVSLWGVAESLGDSLDVRVDSVRIQLQDEYLANRGPIALTLTDDDGLMVRRLDLVGPSGSLQTLPAVVGAPITVRVNAFDLAPWAFLLGMDGRVEGVLSGDISIEPDPKQWITRTDFEIEQARVDGFRADALFSELTYQDNRAFGQIGARFGRGRTYLEGVVDLDVDDPEREIDIRLVSEALPLSAFGGFLPQLTDIDGEMSGQIWMTGLTRDVELNGNMLASSGQFTVPALNRGLKGVTLELDVSPESITFDRFDGSGETGRLSVSGRIDLNPIDFERLLEWTLLGPMDLEIKAENFDAAATPDVKATIDGMVKLTGTFNRPVLSGNIALQKAEVRLLSMLQAPPDPESIWRTVPFFENLQTDLSVTSERQLWVRDEAVNIELSGDLDILRDQNDLVASRSDELGFRFFGTMNSLRGTYRFQNRNFRIYREEDAGGLRFDGERSAAPAVDIKAWARFPILTPGDTGEPTRGEVIITAKVTGSFAQPEVQLFESHPDNLDPAEAADEAIQARLLSYILFGRDPELLIAAEQNLLGEQSTGMLMGMATRELQSRIAQSLNLDLVQVEMRSASEIDRVTVGKYIGDRLFVTYEDQIGQGREFGVEYELFPRFSLESRFEETPDGQVQPSLRFTWGKDW